MKKNGINFDYILALSEENGALATKMINIERHEWLIDQLSEMLDDKSFSLADMHYLVLKELNPKISFFPFCLNHDYYDSYIDDIHFPHLDISEYKIIVSNIQQKIKDAKDVGKISHATDLENQFNRCLHMVKNDYLKSIIPYIFSYDYNEALKMNHVVERYKMFSSEIHGRFEYETKVNDELKIKTRTNFCYGSSSYFQVIVSYKDIELLPYSQWVKYYFAGYSSIMRYTRSYKCCRESWSYAMEYIASYVNKAINNPHSFVKNEVMLEVNDLLSGLEKIFKIKESDFAKKLKVKHIKDDDARYIGISSARHANENDRENYKIKPAECAMIYRMEKISGALYFLNSLQKLSEIFSEVKDVISRIIELNELIYPDIIVAMTNVEKEIKELNIKLSPIIHEYEYFSKNFEYYRRQLNEIQKNLSRTEWQNAETWFEKQNPKYKETEKIMIHLSDEKTRYEKLISNRKKVLSRLESYKHLISRNVGK